MIGERTLSVPLLDLKAQFATIGDEVRTAVDRLLTSQQFILGPEVEALERELADYLGCAHGADPMNFLVTGIKYQYS